MENSRLVEKIATKMIQYYRMCTNFELLKIIDAQGAVKVRDVRYLVKLPTEGELPE